MKPALTVLGLLVCWTVQAAECTWSGADDNWNDAANWSACNGGVPGAGDTAIINAGVVALDLSTVVAGLTMSGGTIDGPHTLTVTDDLRFTGGGSKQLRNLTLDNQGAALWDGGTLDFSTWPNASVFNNHSGATFTISDGLSISHSSASLFDNAGTLVKTGTGLSDISLGLATRNRGLIRVEEGELRINGNHSGTGVQAHTGTFEVLDEATVGFSGTQNFAPDAVITGAGNVAFPWHGGAYVLEAGMTYQIDGRTTVSCNGCTVRVHTDLITGELFMGNPGQPPWYGTLDGSGSITVTGQMDWRQGQIGHLVATAGDGLTVSVLGDMHLHTGISRMLRQVQLYSHGPAVYHSGTFHLSHTTAEFINLPGTTFEIRGPQNLDYRWSAQDSRGTFTNQGTLLKTEAGTATVTGITIVNSGLIDVQTDQLIFRRHASSSDAEMGARLVLNDGVVDSQQPLVFTDSLLGGHGVIHADVENDDRIQPGFSGSTPGSYQAGLLEINGALSLSDTSRVLAQLVSADPQPGIGHSQLRVDAAVGLLGTLVVQVDTDHGHTLNEWQTFVAMTCTGGCTGGFDTTATMPSDLACRVQYPPGQVVVSAAIDTIFTDRFTADTR